MNTTKTKDQKGVRVNTTREMMMMMMNEWMRVQFEETVFCYIYIYIITKKKKKMEEEENNFDNNTNNNATTTFLEEDIRSRDDDGYF